MFSYRPKMIREGFGSGRCVVEGSKEPFAIMLFGASGDLAARKVIPSIFKLFIRGLLPDDFSVLGVARSQWSDPAFREKMGEAVRRFEPDVYDERVWSDFAAHLTYRSATYENPAVLRDVAGRIDGRYGNRLFYLALPPQLYPGVASALGEAGLGREETGWARLVIEKPFGHSLETARALTATLHRYFSESQVFRIDHYLGKETVQNILMFRFANTIFEPVWNRQYIDHVQITAAEAIGVGHRAGYYDGAGVLRDMFQNHMLQLLALVAMEPPARFEAESVRDEKTKVFRAIRPFDQGRLDEAWTFGQYGNGTVDGDPVAGYRQESGVPDKTVTATFAAGVFYVDNWRWKAVPFFLRSGKRLAAGVTEIAIQFSSVPHRMFHDVLDETVGPNVLVFRVKPDEGILQSFYTKVPGSRLCLQPVRMEFSYADAGGELGLDAYQRVLLDAMGGDRLLFVRQDGVELTWSLLDPVLRALEGTGRPPELYPSGIDCPAGAVELAGRLGRTWRSLL